jgi:Fe-S-cluster-containing hydrogenase component 2
MCLESLGKEYEILFKEKNMSWKLAVVPERCSGCKICELVCSINRFGVNNPKKSAIRVMVVYPHPIIRMPIVCRQCKVAKCMENCPTGAITTKDGIYDIDSEKCISCQQCVISCPFGAIFLHEEIETPFKCNLCNGHPHCVEACPKNALLYLPEHVLGQAQRMTSVLKYVHMKEVEYVEKGERKVLRYADIEEGKAED